MLQLTTKTVEETEQIGEQLGKLAGPGGMVVLLTGELGAGKTAFARGGVARGGLGGVTGPVTSPSFTLVEEHQGGGSPFITWMCIG